MRIENPFRFEHRPDCIEQCNFFDEIVFYQYLPNEICEAITETVAIWHIKYKAVC